jgi:putative ABC transport system permease protein
MNLARLKRVVGHRLRSLLRANRADAELAGELAFHLDALVRENVADGMTAREAESAARRKLGNLALLEERCRDQRRVSWLCDLKQDLLYGWRMMRMSPGFTAIAAVSLALGIGANTAILGVADTMLFGTLPYRDAGRLMIVRTYSSQNPGENNNASQPDFFAIQDGTSSFESVGCSLNDQKNLGEDGSQSNDNGIPPEKIYGQAFSPGMFDAFSVAPLLGRTFHDADFRRGPPSVIVLSHRLWTRRFGADPAILGKRVRLDGSAAEIIGVMPAGFRVTEDRPEYWVPMQLTRSSSQAGVRYFIVAARLRRDATSLQAQVELDNVAAKLAADFPDTHKGWGIRVQPIREALFGWTKSGVVTLEAAVMLVLLIACANVAGLLLARGNSRRHELAMRAALGAGRARIVRQLLAESLMLSTLGGVLGVIVAWAALRVLPALHPPPNAPRLEAISLNLHILLLTVLTSLGAGLIFGVGPALAAFRQGLTAALNESPRGAGTPRNRQRSRSFLVAVQVACACMLLIGSGLFIKSFLKLASRDLNFEPHGLLTFEFRYPTWQFQHITGSYQNSPFTAVEPWVAPKFQRILDRLRMLPGVESVAGISSPPMNSLIVASAPLAVDGPGGGSGDTPYFVITPDFFATMRAQVVRGREFGNEDTAGAPWVAVVNATAAARFWPGEDPLGKRFTLDSGPGSHRLREVIGVVRDIPTGSRRINPEPVVYLSYLQQPSTARLSWAIMLGQMTFVVRTSGNPLSLQQEARKAVTEIDPNIPLANLATMEQVTGAWKQDMFYYTAVLGAFALVATLLAAMGAYGVMSYHVAQRTREIGIRMALGAQPWQIFWLVGWRATQLIGTGLSLGLLGGLAVTRLLGSQLWDVAPTDPATFAAAAAVLIITAGLACAGPLRRCVRSCPLPALRVL